jgi:hypothetical protein
MDLTLNPFMRDCMALRIAAWRMETNIEGNNHIAGMHAESDAGISVC